MNKNAIVILNLVGLPEIISVEDFKSENIRKAIQQKFKVDVEQIECLTIGNPCIYGVKELAPSLEGKLESVNIWYSENPQRHAHYIQVLTAIM